MTITQIILDKAVQSADEGREGMADMLVRMAADSLNVTMEVADPELAEMMNPADNFIGG